TLLPTYQRIALYGESVLLCHGDTLCIDDVAYQQYRKKCIKNGASGYFYIFH
ncbi:UDP-2,3-diacylglucosamine hydrolase, partial [Pasteurella multocida subsp. multocida str. Anand1_cattle]